MVSVLPTTKTGIVAMRQRYPLLNITRHGDGETEEQINNGKDGKEMKTEKIVR